MSEWKTYRLGDLCSRIKSGKGIPASEVSTTGEYPVIGGNGIRGYTNTSNFNGVCAVVGRQGAYCGNVRFFSGEAYMTEHAVVIVGNELADTRYLAYLLSIMQLGHLSAQSAQPGLSVQTLSKLSINIPDISTQRRIVGILGSLDDKIELNRRINADLEAQAQALFRSWFVDFEPFRDGPFVDSELGKIPASLKIEHIGNIPHKIESGKRPKGGASEHGIPSIGAENIKGLGIYDYAKTKFIPEDFASTMKKGKINGYELLIYKDGGKPGYFIPNFTIFGEGFPYKEMYINEHVFCLDFFDKGFNTFAYFYMRTPYIMNQLNTIGGKAAIPGINTKDIESLPIFTNENEKVKEFGTLFLPTIKTILQNCVENKTLSALRDTLLPKLIAGEI